MKPLIWMLATLAAVQPLLATDCRCTCRAHNDSPAVVETDRAAHLTPPTCCSKHCRCSSSKRSNSRGSTVAVAYRIRFAPCDCPTDCECQSRHWTGSDVLRQFSAIKGSIHDSLISKLTSTVPVVSESECVSPAGFGRYGAAVPISALPLCAALCRFLA